ncbi:MAG: class I SAM-dependent methyltransferase, partial [Nitrospirota bacterium]
MSSPDLGAVSPPSQPRRLPAGAISGAAPAIPPGVHSTKNLTRLLKGLAACASPHLLDLGRLSGANIEWLIHRRCKVTVDDQITGLRPAAPPPPRPPRGKEKAPPPPVALDLRHPDNSFDAILCWDLFDYLDRPSMQASLQRLAALIKPKGYLLAFFNCQRGETRPAVRYRIVSEE